MTLAAVVPVVLVGIMQWLMPALMPPTIPFGVRIPRDHADAPVITAWRRRYRLATADRRCRASNMTDYRQR